MPRPNDPLSLIPSETRKLLPTDWLDEFGSFKWCYIAGIREIAHLSNRRDLPSIAGCAGHALQALPDDWKRAFPDGDYGKFNGGKQIGSAKQFEPVRFDKALLIVLALEEFARLYRCPTDIYEIVQIRPSIFQIEDLAKDAYEKVVSNRLLPEIKDVLNYTFDDDVPFSHILKDGRGATEEYIDAITSVCADNNLDIGGAKRTLQDRTDGGALTLKKMPAQSQISLLNIPDVTAFTALRARNLKGNLII